MNHVKTKEQSWLMAPHEDWLKGTKESLKTLGSFRCDKNNHLSG